MKRILASPYFYLAIIIITGLFFRLYQLEHFSPYAHDEDLYSWIVKDILIDHHFRLIGQVTSIPGVFIGPLFYYILIPFFALFDMDPAGAIGLSAINGILTILSVYYVFSKIFNKTTGLIGSFIYSVSLNIALFDRWIVPTMFVPIWSVWFLYIIFCIQRGEYKKFWILGVLTGLIWHIHIALLPLLGLVPIALVFTKKRPRLTSFIFPIVLAVTLLIPFFAFEIKHNFSQTLSIFASFGKSVAEAEGLNRFMKIIDASSVMMTRSLVTPWPLQPSLIYPLLIAGLIFLKFKKVLSSPQLTLIFLWFISIIVSQEISKRGISEYYFASFIIIPILCISLLLDFIRQKFHRIKIAELLILSYFIFNLISFINLPFPREALAEKKQVVDFIVSDAKSKNFPCIQLNFIVDPGNDGGFRYLFWWKNYQLIKSGRGAPVYSIVLPWSYSPKESNPIFGKIGVIEPIIKEFTDKKVCNDPTSQLDPLMGFYN
ncbi:MAG: glycosyltransferase family 39 protein [Microgenomates group bacterium]|jgi:4-amino-4-deoxy-L-arabinose transferase-like glycosyltransferase